jgi:hypothetical protein
MDFVVGRVASRQNECQTEHADDDSTDKDGPFDHSL